MAVEVEAETLTIRQLRRRWKPIKDRLNAVQDNHPTAIHVHRAFSWMARVENLEDGVDLDVALERGEAGTCPGFCELAAVSGARADLGRVGPHRQCSHSTQEARHVDPGR